MEGNKKDVAEATEQSTPSKESLAGDDARQDKRQPVAKFNCASDKDTYIEVAVWENAVTYRDGSTGTQLSTTFARSYKNGESWKTTHSFRQHDMPLLYYLLQKAHGWMLEQRITAVGPF